MGQIEWRDRMDRQHDRIDEQMNKIDGWIDGMYGIERWMEWVDGMDK